MFAAATGTCHRHDALRCATAGSGPEIQFGVYQAEPESCPPADAESVGRPIPGNRHAGSSGDIRLWSQPIAGLECARMDRIGDIRYRREGGGSAAKPPRRAILSDAPGLAR